MNIAIITGASSGIGKEFVQQLPYFYKNLDEIWVIARRTKPLYALEKCSSLPIRVIAGDLGTFEIYQQIQDLLEQYRPKIRLLVNAAGFGKSGRAEHIFQTDSTAQWKMIDINCRAVTQMTLLCFPYFSKGSRVIQIASAAAFFPQPGFAVYAATKAYVLSFSRALQAEWKKKEVFVTVVCPGPVDTEFFLHTGAAIPPLKKLCMTKASNVVKKALLDSKKQKRISIYGAGMKLIFSASKIIPHAWVTKIEAMGMR